MKTDYLRKWHPLTTQLRLFVLVLLVSCGKEEAIPQDGDSGNNPIWDLSSDAAENVWQGDAPEFTKVNIYNQDLLLPGYQYFRIPSLTTTNTGTLVAVCEMRTEGDQDPKTLVYRRSTDQGKTWGPVTLIEEQTYSEIYGNPVLINNGVTGNLHLIYMEIIPSGNSNSSRIYQRISTDDGLSWSERVEIPNLINASWRPVGPGIGIQLQRGQHVGRLVVPGRYIDSQRGNYCFYSDDHGLTWHAGYRSTLAGDGAENETACVELAELDGDNSMIYINSRNENSTSTNVFRRLEAYSMDSGESLTDEFRRNEFIKTDRCQAALLRWAAMDQGDANNRILFSSVSWAKENVALSAQSRRRHMGVWSTFDETDTWTQAAKRVNDIKAGYSSMTKTNDGYIGIVFEEGESNYFSEMSFVKLNEAYLDIPVIGAKWDFEDQTAGEVLEDGMFFYDSFTNGTNRPLQLKGGLETVEGSESFQGKTALKFDGNGYLETNDFNTWTQFDFNENTSFTLEVVFRTGQSNNPSTLLGRPHQPGYPQWIIRKESNGKISFRMDDDETYTYLSTSNALTDNLWHHLAIVRDRSSNKIKMYIDGELMEETLDNVKGAPTNRQSLVIGGDKLGGNFKGEIDFIRITPIALNDFLN